MEKKTLKNKNRKTASTILCYAILLSMLVTMFTLPSTLGSYDNATANAISAGMTWNFTGASNYNASGIRLMLWERYADQIPTNVFEVISPNPVGVGQSVSIVAFNPQVPNAAVATNDIRYQYYLTITKPDNTTERLPSTGTQASDSTGSTYFKYTPNQIGNYSFTITFAKLFYSWYSSATERNYYGVTLKESTYTSTLAVQQEAVSPLDWSTFPLPTEYWTRPIEGQNTEWWKISSNWYASAEDQNNGGMQNGYQPDGTAPNTGHILWTKSTEDGGLVGGGNFSTPGEVFNAGHVYQPRFTNHIIMNGKLYYQEPRYFSPGGGDIFTAVDLRTGETLWKTNITTAGAPTFGYMYDWDDMNQHGVAPPALLFTNNFARAYHALYGDLTGLNITGVPSLTAARGAELWPNNLELAGPKGESLRYSFRNLGTASNPNWTLSQWNSSKVFTSITGGVQNINASVDSCFDWTILAPWVTSALSVGSVDTSNITIRAGVVNDILLISNGSNPAGSNSLSYNYPPEVTFRAVSIKPESRGQVLWVKNIQTANLGTNYVLQYQRAAEGVFVMALLPEVRYVGYSMYTGEKLWESSIAETDYNPYAYYTFASGSSIPGATKIAYSTLYSSGYSGMVFAYDLKTGNLLWQYTAPTGMQIFPYYTSFVGAIADGKLYVGTIEHSADTPLLKGNQVRVLNATTGEELWTMYGYAEPLAMVVADGTLVYLNNYDQQIYAVAKGPSAMTVESPMQSISLGSSLMIRGTVTDISAGTSQAEQAARFPNGVPAVSDESMSAWMEYVYMQKPRPTNATGVPVTISVVDANGNYRTIGTTTSSSDGFYSLNWTPDIAGKYSVYATFAGSESYWPTHAETAFAVDPAAPTPTPASTQTPSAADLYFLPMSIGIIVAVIVVGALLFVMLNKKP
jgi:outer membrane protein assembly factor BamB